MATAMNSLSPLQSGYTLKIFNNGDIDRKFKCNHCGLVLREPVQSYCGHRFCRLCIEGVLSNGDSVQCPACTREDMVNEEFSMLKLDQMFPDNGLKREMAKMKCSCINLGCNWKGNFQQYEKHLLECQFKPVGCELCGQTVEVLKLKEHQKKDCPSRQIKCSACGEKFLAHQENDHKQECAMLPILCEACNTRIPKSQMQLHSQSECPNQRTKCPVCNQEVLVSQFYQHVNSKQKKDQHLTWIFVQIGHLQQMLGLPSASGPPAPDPRILDNQIRELQQKLREQEQLIQSLPSQSVSSTTDSAAGLQKMKTDIATLELKINTFEGIATTLTKEIERCVGQLETFEVRRNEERSVRETFEQKIRTFDRTLQLKDIAIAEQNTRLQALEHTSYNGILLWKITDFNKHKNEAIQGRYLTSPYFFTSRTGYKMCARLYLAGDGLGKGTHMSLFFVILRGPSDPLLQWPFQHQVTFLLIDQNFGNNLQDTFQPDPTSTSFKKPTSDANAASGCPLFLPLSRLQDSGTAYVKEDTMFIKVSVNIQAGNTQHGFL